MTSAPESVSPRPDGLLRSRGFHLFLGLAVSAGCLWWATRDLFMDAAARGQFFSAFRQADYRHLPLLLGMLLAFYSLKAYRWTLLLRPIGGYRTWADCFGPMLAGFAVNNTLPARAGEVVRVMVFARRSGQPVTAVLATVALERILDMLSILSLLGLGLVLLPDMDARIRASAMGMAIIAGAGVAGAVVFLMWSAPVIRLTDWGLARIRVPEIVHKKLIQMLESAARGLAALRSPGIFFQLIVVSLAKWLLNGGMMFLSLRSFAVDVPFAAALVLLGVVALAVAFPAAPGFFGVIQVCFTSTLKGFAVSLPAVLAASIYYHIIQYVPVTVGGLLWLSKSGFRMQAIQGTTLPNTPQPPDL
ncbi:MAG: UPF0104 family protein [Planctomycetota bacterium]|nr:MAG: UPF0104 family protein [Planctomycetota bacterium]